MTNYWYLYRKAKNALFMSLTFASALVILVPLFWILYYLTRQGLSAINIAFFTQLPKPVGEPGGGMANAIVGTLVLLGIACIIAIPIGALAGVYLAEHRNTRAGGLLRFAADVLVGVPSIVVGIFAYALIVLPMHRFSAFAGGVALAVMMIPIVARTTEESLKMVPRALAEGSLALGAPRWVTVTRVVLPAAKSGVVTGILLAIARVSGETAPLLFTAFGNSYWSVRLDQPIAALPLEIYNYAVSPYDDWHRQAWGAALVLITGLLLVNILARILSRNVHGTVK